MMKEVRETQDQLAQHLADAAQKVAVGARYEHYKKLSYKVLTLALREEDNEPVVVYQAEYGARVTFTRSVVSWLEKVDVGGEATPRFKKYD